MIRLQELCKQKVISLLNLVERSGVEFKQLQAIYLNQWTPNPTQRKIFPMHRALGVMTLHGNIVRLSNIFTDRNENRER